MQPDALGPYLAETARIASEQGGLLDHARERLLANKELNRLEENGVLHALQILIENAIGKAKHIVKAHSRSVPVSAYDNFEVLRQLGIISNPAATEWIAIIGLRNKLVHDYMNVDVTSVRQLVIEERYRTVIEFLMAPLPRTLRNSN
jgi:uncharacterized protein YutE (UPF0331/DUF86 family)